MINIKPSASFSILFLYVLRQHNSSGSEFDYRCQQQRMNLVISVADLKCC